MTIADWTVDKLLGEFRTINQKAESEHAKLRANRTRYMTILRSLPSVPDNEARAELRAKLTTWIHDQVAAENRFQDFSSKWTAVKNGIKSFLNTVHINPPEYLGQVQVLGVPVAIVGLLLAAASIVAIIAIANRNQTKALDGINRVLTLARDQGWTADQTSNALRNLASATGAAQPDPFGLGKLIPVVLIVAAIVLIPKVLPGRAAA